MIDRGADGDACDFLRLRPCRRQQTRVRAASWEEKRRQTWHTPLGYPDTIRPAFAQVSGWWQDQDSNLGRHCRRFYRPLPLAARARCRTARMIAVEGWGAQPGLGSGWVVALGGE